VHVPGGGRPPPAQIHSTASDDDDIAEELDEELDGSPPHKQHQYRK